ncbi:MULTISPECIES: siroheme synthase CysG [unclassified Thioalkalivibrio]|uniref:siroheme synthase CysG n=1 Tax=unclassified Thioalkalivibrio TaxID=2621013 RepID=UPI00036AE23D|nr:MULTISPECIES: siroheme synthase CysG [unclassified Thioalkalivibrio]
MEHLPIYMQLHGREALVVGAGPVATRKAALLLEAGARVRLRAPEYSDASERLLREQPESISRDPGVYDTECLDRVAIVIAATDDAAVNRQVSEDCVARSIPVNVADQPELCSFILPAIVERGPLTIAIGSGGRAPVLVRLLRAKIESLIPTGYGRLADLAGRLRDRVRARFDHVNARRAFWERAFAGPATELALAGRMDAAEARLEQELADAATSTPGEVYLIGAGPGDPDLLTFRALRLLQQADVVVYDRLVSSEVVNLARREAERFYVGKERDHHCVPQEEISALLSRLAREGKRVARLKGGDPFVFGRGGEELDVLARHGVAYQVVPGITAASGCSAYAGIPLTHRDHAQSVRFITGHTREGRLDVDWSQLTSTRETLVFYMGRKGVGEICRGLKGAGRAGQTPAAIIENGTTARQRVVTGTLDTLAARAEREQVGSPSLIVIGEVAACHARLAWFQPDAGATTVFPQPMPMSRAGSRAAAASAA